MSLLITDLEPKILWKNFNNLNAVPRASTKEAQVIQFVKNFGEQLQLETLVDETGNVIIKKPATIGYETKETIVLQAHLDMVHQKNSDIDFDFTTQGINMYVEGDWVKARGTTLGADNGIGVAAIMSILESTSLSHPAIEALFTVDEEIGMTGAMALKSNQLSGKKLLNLDTEEDNELTIGSAGGVDVVIEGTYKTQSIAGNYTHFQMTVKGLTGGHSGVDIHLCRANAIKILNRLLFEIIKKVKFKLVTIEGGELTNAIPRECTTLIAVKNKDIALFNIELSQLTHQIKAENSFTDPLMSIDCIEVGNKAKVASPFFAQKLFQNIYACPNNSYRMTPEMLNLVQSSNNLAKIRVKDGVFKLECHTRSFIESERKDIVNAIESSFSGIGAKIEEVGAYPGWEPKPNTPLVKIMTQIYIEMYGVLPKINAIHAGLECGIIAETFPEIQLVSFGPNIKSPHSPQERLQISSTQKFWAYLQKVICEI